MCPQELPQLSPPPPPPPRRKRHGYNMKKCPTVTRHGQRLKPRGGGGARNWASLNSSSVSSIKRAGGRGSCGFWKGGWGGGKIGGERNRKRGNTGSGAPRPRPPQTAEGGDGGALELNLLLPPSLLSKVLSGAPRVGRSKANARASTTYSVLRPSVRPSGGGRMV